MSGWLSMERGLVTFLGRDRGSMSGGKDYVPCVARLGIFSLTNVK